MEGTTDQVLARRRRVVLVVAATLLLVVVAVMIGSAVQTTEPRPEPLPGGDLLPWAARGELADDPALVASAEALWRGATDVDDATVVAPAGEVYLLWADQIAAGRLVLMQAVGADGRPYVAQVSEQGDPAVLGLDTVQALPADTPIVLAVTYGGNLHIPGLEPGRGSAYIQLLTEPPESSDSTGLWYYETIAGPGRQSSRSTTARCCRLTPAARSGAGCTPSRVLAPGPGCAGCRRRSRPARSGCPPAAPEPCPGPARRGRPARRPARRRASRPPRPLA